MVTDEPPRKWPGPEPPDNSFGNASRPPVFRAGWAPPVGAAPWAPPAGPVGTGAPWGSPPRPAAYGPGWAPPARRPAATAAKGAPREPSRSPSADAGPEPPATPLGIVKYAMQDKARAVRLCYIALVLSVCAFGGITAVVEALKGYRPHLHLQTMGAEIHGLNYLITAILFLSGSALTFLGAWVRKKIRAWRAHASNDQD
jgi:hypothetical protein